MLVTMVVALGLVAASVFALDDRETLVSPAEAVAEDFVRALTTGRYDAAAKYVDPHAGYSREEIRSWSDQLRQHGAVEGVEVTPLSNGRQDASVKYTVTLVSKQEISGDLRLSFDREWQITR